MDADAAGCRFCLHSGRLDDELIFPTGSCYFLGSVDPALPHAGTIIPFRHCATPFDLRQPANRRPGS
jgi:hypothetical protein